MIGFVGLGNVGEPAALNLIAAGFTVHGFDLRRNQAFVDAGGIWADSLADLPPCEVIFQSLPSPSALNQTIDALVPHLRPGQVIADISSYPIEAKSAAAARVAASGATMLDCEVSGLPFQVVNRTAVLFCAGDEAAVEACGPAFEAFTARHFYLGRFGAATNMKLIANFMVCAHNLVGAEALNLGRAAGLDPTVMVDVLRSSAAGSTTFGNKAPIMLSRDFAQGRGPFRHMFGYLARAQALAQECGVSGAVPVLDRVRSIYSRAETDGRHDQDIAAIIEVIEKMAGEGN